MKNNEQTERVQAFLDDASCTEQVYAWVCMELAARRPDLGRGIREYLGGKIGGLKESGFRGLDYESERAPVEKTIALLDGFDLGDGMGEPAGVTAEDAGPGESEELTPDVLKAWEIGADRIASLIIPRLRGWKPTFRRMILAKVEKALPGLDAEDAEIERHEKAAERLLGKALDGWTAERIEGLCGRIEAGDVS